MNLEQAADRFRTAISHCDNLVEVHRASGQNKIGRRYRETSINRAVVVVAVACWQAAAEDFATCVLEAGTPGAQDAVSADTYRVIRSRAEQEIKRFNTPNAKNVRTLLRGVGFDPRPHWTMPVPGSPPLGPEAVEERINAWVRLRHEVAHGAPSLTKSRVLQSVRENRSGASTWEPQLRLNDAEACIAFFRRLAHITGQALAKELTQESPRWLA